MSNKYQDGEVRIRKAVKDDMETVYRMTKELIKFLQIPDAQKISCKDLERDGFETQPPLFHCLMAELLNGTTTEVVGYAMYYSGYSTMVGRTMFLQNLYVKEKYRRRGVGDKLFGALAKEAVKTGCSRIDFEVITSTESPSFYHRQGATNLTESMQLCAYSLKSEAMLNIARNAGDE